MERQVRREDASGLHAGAPRSYRAPLLSAFEIVADDMVACEEALGRVLRGNSEAVSAIGDYLMKSGGKRLRPLLTALGGRAAGNSGNLSELMCVGELMHLGSLLHDDVVDDSPTRRGRAAAQIVYGNAGVILTGDVCVARGLALAAREAGLVAVTALAETVAEMSEGEVTQLLNSGNGGASMETYFEIVDKKSASLIAWCAAAGAWACDKEEEANALYSFGRKIGAAFQITDDVLDYTGDVDVIGKGAGQDAAQGKATLPLIIAMERDPSIRELLGEELQNGEAAKRGELIVSRVVATGAPEAALAVARKLVLDGITSLERLEESSARDALSLLANHLVERVS